MKLSLVLSILLLTFNVGSTCFPGTEEEGRYKGDLLNGLAHGEGKCKGKRGKTTYKRIKEIGLMDFLKDKLKLHTGRAAQ